MPGKWRQRFDTNTVRRNLDDVSSLSKSYLREQTIEPIKQLGRYSAFGCLGSLFVGLGSLFALVGILRLLQDETAVFRGNLSWLPYLIVLVLALGETALVAWTVVSGPARRRLPKKEAS